MSNPLPQVVQPSECHLGWAHLDGHGRDNLLRLQPGGGAPATELLLLRFCSRPQTCSLRPRQEKRFYQSAPDAPERLSVPRAGRDLISSPQLPT